jgi:pentatricopeptide repeat protein
MPGILQESRNNGMWKKASPSPSRGLSSKVCAGQRHVEEGYHPNRGDAEVEVEPDVRIYNGLVDIFSNYGPLAHARRLFDKMRAQGMKPDIYLTSPPFLRLVVIRISVLLLK